MAAALLPPRVRRRIPAFADAATTGSDPQLTGHRAPCGAMSTDPPRTKQERREAARRARLDGERSDAVAALRRKRLTTLLAVLGAAAVLVVVAIVVSGG